MEKYNTETLEQDFHFQYPDPDDPMFSELKRIAGIEASPDKNVLDNANDIIGYTHKLFTHNGDNTPSAEDPLTILKEARAGQSFRCVEYSTLAAGLLWANGIPARTIGLKTSDVETREYGAGHVVIEFWDSDLDKWIMSDVQAGVIPKLDEVPLSSYELSQALGQNDSVTYAPVAGSRFFEQTDYNDKKDYPDWIKEYLYFIDTPIHLTLGNEDKREQQRAMLIPLGAKPPEMFQGSFKMNALYTHSILDFYLAL